ncbi:MAG: hypothetical protein V3R81_12965, partial [Gammaproteobacteria bacterium]
RLWRFGRGGPWMAVLKSGGIRLVPRFPLVGHLEAGAPIDPSNPTPHVRPKRGGVTRSFPLLFTGTTSPAQ